VRPVLLRAIEAYDLSMSNAALTERMVLMDRCATLGRSVAQLAHEIGNQLCILPLLEMIEDSYNHDAELTRMAGLSRDSYQRMVGLLNEVKAFVRFERDAPAGKNIRLAEVVHELVDFLRYDRTLTNLTLSLNLWTNPYITGNNVKLQQVLINLLKNAADALGDRADGAVTISLDNDANTATLVVADNGPGMPPEVAARIWEPFYSTKGAGGTGLGLDVARTIIEAHHGTIHCETAPDQGARFVIRLPIAAVSENDPSKLAAGQAANVVVKPVPWEPPPAAISLLKTLKSP
jgi:signal transduction histidine kinase